MGRKRDIFPLALACSVALHLLGTTLYLRFGSYFLSSDLKKPRSPELVIRVDPELVDFGEATGHGMGINSSPGERPMDAREADENQALLSREPTGFGDRLQSPSDLRGPSGGGGGSASA